MTLSLPYVFIPGDNWEKIAMSPDVSPEAGRHVVDLMRLFANQPRFTEYLLAGGIGWLDIPFGGTGVRLHYRTLARQGTRPLLYGLGLFHDSQARRSAGGFVSLITTLDKSLPRADVSSSFPTGGFFEAPESVAGVAESDSLSWRDVEGRSETLAPADAYRRIAACSTDEGDWRTLWKVQYDMPKIIDQAATAFFSPKFPCKDLERFASRNPPPPTPDLVPRQTEKVFSCRNCWQIRINILLLFLSVLLLISTVICYRWYTKVDNALTIALKQRDNALNDSEDDRNARIVAEIAEIMRKTNGTQRTENTMSRPGKEADAREQNQKAEALERLNRDPKGNPDAPSDLDKDTPNGNPLPNTPAPTE